MVPGNVGPGSNSTKLKVSITVRHDNHCSRYQFYPRGRIQRRTPLAGAATDSAPAPGTKKRTASAGTKGCPQLQPYGCLISSRAWSLFRAGGVGGCHGMGRPTRFEPLPDTHDPD